MSPRKISGTMIVRGEVGLRLPDATSLDPGPLVGSSSPRTRCSSARSTQSNEATTATTIAAAAIGRCARRCNTGPCSNGGVGCAAGRHRTRPTTFRSATISCCRSIAFSGTSAARDRNRSTTRPRTNRSRSRIGASSVGATGLIGDSMVVTLTINGRHSHQADASQTSMVGTLIRRESRPLEG
jgi:hypothetical protein